MHPKLKRSDAEETVIRLCQKDAEFILNLLEHPPKRNRRLREAVAATRKACGEKQPPDFAANLKNCPVVGQRMIEEITGDSDLLMRHLKLSPRLRKALDLAGASELPIREFCRRFPYQVLKRHRGFLNNTVVELVALFYRDEDVARWLRTVPQDIRGIGEGIARNENMAAGRVEGVTGEETYRDVERASKRKKVVGFVKRPKNCVQSTEASERTRGPRPLAARELGLRKDRKVSCCLKILHRFFPDPKNARHWLKTPHPQLGGVPALIVLRTNPNAVLTLLSNAENGIPS
jgi:hypothetical protein